MKDEDMESTKDKSEIPTPMTDEIYIAYGQHNQIGMVNMTALSRRLEKEATVMSAELVELREWKRQQVFVDSKWDAQAVGKVMNLTLGSDIRPSIQPYIETANDLLKDYVQYGDGREIHDRTLKHLGVS